MFDFLLYTVYSLRTSGFFPNSTALRSVHSTRTDKNSDGSGAIDIAALRSKAKASNTTETGQSQGYPLLFTTELEE